MYEPVRNRMHAHRTEPASNVSVSAHVRQQTDALRCKNAFLHSRDALCIRLCIYVCVCARARAPFVHTSVVHVGSMYTSVFTLATVLCKTTFDVRLWCSVWFLGVRAAACSTPTRNRRKYLILFRQKIICSRASQAFPLGESSFIRIIL